MWQLSEKDVRRAIRVKMADENVTQRQVADVLKLHETHLSDMLRGVRPLNDRILAWVGVEKVFYYRRIKTPRPSPDPTSSPQATSPSAHSS